METIKITTPDGTKYMEVVGAGTESAPYRPVNEVFVQDQFSPIVDRFLTRELGSGTLAANAAYNTRTLVLTAGHGFTQSPAVSEMIEIYYDNEFYQSRVLTVDVNTITVTNPIPFDIPSGTTFKRSSPDCNVDGSTTPVVFCVRAPEGKEYDITALCVNMLDNVEMDDSKFGGLDAPISGVIYRKTNTTKAVNIFTAVDNGCYIRHCDTENPYSPKAPQGFYGFNTKRYFKNEGVTVRIGDGNEYHCFEVVVTANLTGLTRFWNVVRGHEVE
jgi:hypothetical protein